MANDEHVEIVRNGKEAIAEWWAADPDGPLDLSCADLNEAYLSGANLSGAKLSGANLNGANIPVAELY